MSTSQEVEVSNTTVATSSNVAADQSLAFDDGLSDLVSHLDDLLNQVDEIDSLYDDGDGETILYGPGQRIAQVREKAGGMWTSVKSSLGSFFKKLTTRTNGKLPDWVYSASEGVLQSMITYIEERLSEDGDNNKVSIEMLRQGINALRARIIDASGAEPEEVRKLKPVEQKKKPESPESDDD